MTQSQKEQLTRIYNTLMLISTKGEDTLVMADCLRAIQQLYNEETSVLENLVISEEE